MLEEAGLFRKLTSRPTCYLFLFNDVLVVTKKKRWARRGRPAWGWAATAALGSRPEPPLTSELGTRSRGPLPAWPAHGCQGLLSATPHVTWGGWLVPLACGSGSLLQP